MEDLSKKVNQIEKMAAAQLTLETPQKKRAGAGSPSGAPKQARGKAAEAKTAGSESTSAVS